MSNPRTPKQLYAIWDNVGHIAAIKALREDYPGCGLAETMHAFEDNKVANLIKRYKRSNANQSRGTSKDGA